MADRSELARLDAETILERLGSLGSGQQADAALVPFYLLEDAAAVDKFLEEAGWESRDEYATEMGLTENPDGVSYEGMYVEGESDPACMPTLESLDENDQVEVEAFYFNEEGTPSSATIKAWPDEDVEGLVYATLEHITEMGMGHDYGDDEDEEKDDSDD